MRQSLQERCEVQIRNEEVFHKARKVEWEHILKLGALMYVNAGRVVDPEHVKQCKEILKEKTGILSNFRGYLQYILQVKMSLADDPASYLDDVMDTYEKLRAGRKLPGEMVVMAATTICDNCPADKRDDVIQKTRDAYDRIKEQHRFITDESDLALIALVVMAGLDPDEIAAKAEELYATLKDGCKIGSGPAHSAALVLALSGKPADQKVNDFIALYDACKAAGHATAKDDSMAVYAAFADLNADRAELVSEIGEVDLWLKKQKGYGALGVGGSVRRMFAATLVLEDHQADAGTITAGVTSAVTEAVLEQMLLILIAILISVIIMNSVVASTAH